MVIDTSALIAILCDEPQRRAFNEAIESADERALSAASFVECSIVIEARLGAAGLAALDRFIAAAGIEVVPVDFPQAQAARLAWSLYGRRRHRAGLDYGACFSYALAKTLGSPLLYQGEDFSQTDIAAAAAR